MDYIMEILMVVIIVIGCCVVLPIMIVWLTNRRKQYEIDKQTEILMAMMEKHPNTFHLADHDFSEGLPAVGNLLYQFRHHGIGGIGGD